MIGKRIAHYEITEKLGEGGMGVVYKANDTKLKRDVAIKFLPRQIAASEQERERFRIEAQAAAALNHPNIATIHAIEEVDDEMFIVMEYIDGRELKDVIADVGAKHSQRGVSSETDDGPRNASPQHFAQYMPTEQIIDIATQIAEGLQAAHAKGIVHRDIKSSNIMVTEEGRVKVMDFGLAKIGAGAQITKDNSTLGTLAYMSPEQVKGEELNQRTDIWSFGVVLYEMLTGVLPFQGYYDQAIIYSILNEEPKLFWEPDSREPVHIVIKKTLQKNRDKRYGQMSEVIHDLTAPGTSETVSTAKITGKGIKKLAVLPFTNMVNDPGTNFLGFALADQIIGAMAYSKNVLVRPSSSIRKYQDAVVDIQKSGAELNVSYILAGSYMKEADTIRLNIELVDLESEKMLWRERIQVKYNNAFELQDIVSQKVVDGLKIQFSEEERERMKPDTPQSPAAYEFYLRAISYPQNLEGSTLAIGMLNRAIQLDPLYAPAYLELGIRYNQFSQVGQETADAFEKSEKALLKALSLKHDLLPALAYLALIYTDIGKHEEAHSLLIRALKINPNDAWIHFSLSYHYRYIGFLEEAEKEIETALSIDPGNPRFRSSIIVYMFLGKYDKIESFDLDIDSPFTLNYLGEAFMRMGNHERALACFEKVLGHKEEVGEFYFASSLVAYIQGNVEIAFEFTLKRESEDPADGEIWYEIARIYGLLNKTEDCERALTKSVELGYLCYPAMHMDAFLDPVRQEPGIQNILEKTRTRHEELKEKLL